MRLSHGQWENWSGRVRCRPGRVVSPQTEDELAAVLGAGFGPVRVPGAGHSFSALNTTDGVMIDLSAFAGLIAVDAGRMEVRFGAATPLWQIGPLLHQHGLALRNMGDIDRQTLAGVVSTGTHGTGLNLGSFSTDVTGFRIMLADGRVVGCSPLIEPDLFQAGRLGLGMMGVLLEIILQVRPVFGLRERYQLLPVKEMLAQSQHFAANHRHFEVFWFAYADQAVCKFLDEIDVADRALPSMEAIYAAGEEYDAQARIFALANEILPLVPPLRGVIHRFFSERLAMMAREGWSYEIFPSARNVKFQEMEYAVPLDAGPDCLREIGQTIRAAGLHTGYPIEYRVVAADDVWLSPFYQRDSATIAVHQYFRQDERALFKRCEDIFRSYQGRAHWGKLHRLTPDRLKELYPRYDDFCALRAELDPKGQFLNSYLRALFG